MDGNSGELVCTVLPETACKRLRILMNCEDLNIKYKVNLTVKRGAGFPPSAAQAGEVSWRDKQNINGEESPVNVTPLSR